MDNLDGPYWKLTSSDGRRARKQTTFLSLSTNAAGSGGNNGNGGSGSHYSYSLTTLNNTNVNINSILNNNNNNNNKSNAHNQQLPQQIEQYSKPIIPFLKRKKNNNSLNTSKESITKDSSTVDVDVMNSTVVQPDSIVQEEEKVNNDNKHSHIDNSDDKEVDDPHLSVSPARTPIKQSKLDHDPLGIRNTAIIPSSPPSNTNKPLQQRDTLNSSIDDSFIQEDGDEILVDSTLPRSDSNLLNGLLLSLKLDSPTKQQQPEQLSHQEEEQQQQQLLPQKIPLDLSSPDIQLEQTKVNVSAVSQEKVEILGVSQRLNIINTAGSDNITTNNDINSNNINNNNNIEPITTIPTINPSVTNEQPVEHIDSSQKNDKINNHPKRPKNLGISSGLDGSYWTAPIESKRQRKPLQNLLLDLRNSNNNIIAITTQITKKTKETTTNNVDKAIKPKVNPTSRLSKQVAKKEKVNIKSKTEVKIVKSKQPKQQLKQHQQQPATNNNNNTLNEEPRKKFQITLTLTPKKEDGTSTPTKTLTYFVEKLPNNIFTKQQQQQQQSPTPLEDNTNLQKLFEQSLLEIEAEDLKEGFLAYAGSGHQHVKLFVGGKGCLYNKDWLDREQISSFINATKEITHPKDIKTDNHLRIPVSDSMDQRICSYFDEATEFLQRSLDSNQSVLVHCREGRSRSTTIVIAYGIKILNLPLKECYDIVARNVPRININSGFLNQLMEYELNVHGKNSVNFFAKGSRRQAAAMNKL